MRTTSASPPQAARRDGQQSRPEVTKDLARRSRGFTWPSAHIEEEDQRVKPRDDSGARKPEPPALARGKRFHTEVQMSFVAGLLGITLDNATEQTFHRPDSHSASVTEAPPAKATVVACDIGP